MCWTDNAIFGRRALLRDAAVLAPAGLVYLRGHGLPTIGEMATRLPVESSFGIFYSPKMEC